MNEICVDASVIVKLAVAGEAHRATARRLVRNSIAAGVRLIAPPFYVSEVDTAIRRRVYEGRWNTVDAHNAFAVLDRAPVEVLTHPNLRERARGIAEQFNQRTVYDSTYAALAELRGCEFWTADNAFYLDVEAALAFVRYLPDYP